MIALKAAAIERNGEPMRNFIFAAVMLLWAGASIPAWGQDPCDEELGGPDVMKEALLHAKSCQAAIAQWRKCPTRDSTVIASDMRSVIIEKCEKPFLDKLSVAAQNRYADEKQLCFYRYARQEGSMWEGYIGECMVDVAARFAADPTLANEPAFRAGLDCDHARTRLETAICSDAGLGRADLVLSRQYQAVRKNHKNEWAALAGDDKEWRQSLPAECDLRSTPSPKSLECLRTVFENRFTALEDCDDPPKCLAIHEYVANEKEETFPDRIAGAAAARAKHGTSFDCVAPSSVLESVVCQDARLGRTEMKLARAYYHADQTMTGEHTALVDSQRRWLGLVNGTCPMGASERQWFRFRFGRPPLATRACVGAMFEKRIAQLQTCSKKGPQDRLSCLNEFQLEPTPAAQRSRNEAPPR
jgi:uncharacterized protein